MAGVNPGPAVTNTANTLAGYTTVNSTVSSTGVITNENRCIAIARGVPITGTGDIAVIPLINCTSFILDQVCFANAVGGTAAALTVSMNGGPAVTGTSMVASAALTNLTGPTKYVFSTIAEAANTSIQAATMGTSGGASNFIYVNATVASAAATTMDIFVYAFDIS
jgi:hypothetical protein